MANKYQLTSGAHILQINVLKSIICVYQLRVERHHSREKKNC